MIELVWYDAGKRNGSFKIDGIDEDDFMHSESDAGPFLSGVSIQRGFSYDLVTSLNSIRVWPRHVKR